MTLTAQSETTGNWEAADGQKWTVPFNFLISTLSMFGVFPASYQFRRRWVRRPSGHRTVAEDSRQDSWRNAGC